jgi:CSLREA domain-containing protein
MNATLPRHRRAKLPRAMPALAGLLAACVPAAHAATFVVTSASDPGTGGCTSSECTLREAITAANATVAADAIHFSFRAIAGKEILIQPTSPLPTITQPVTIDGYSAVNTSVNTLP